jgi:diphosphomevalonate decarboxylase
MKRSAWRSPSNLAIVKYWGKHGRQLPRNPSISFTLSEAHTETTVQLAERTQLHGGAELSFLFSGRENPAFKAKLHKFLDSIHDLFPFLAETRLEIASDNSFPHSAGIASSASAMSALALCLCDLERQLLGNLRDESDFLRKASVVARLGSGSACRSVYPYMAAWGECAAIPGSSDNYAVPFEPHPVFQTFHDDILIVSRAEKTVSSTAGHGLMEGNPYAPVRYDRAHQNMSRLTAALRSGDLEVFGAIAEAEALSLHALMMISEPGYLLLEPNSLAAVRAVEAFRAETKLPVYFSFDAGPNLHLLYPHEVFDQVTPWLESTLAPLCQNGQIIRDQVGKGPERLYPAG